MNSNETVDTREVLSTVALRHLVVRRLLNAIFLGDLPSGSRLIVLKLAAQFGLSSTPVREALFELEAVGVIHFVHNHGAIVNPFGPDQLRQIYHLRRILEAEAARTACGRIDKDELKALRRERQKLAKGRRTQQWAEQEMASDRRLHELIVVSCGNERLAQEIRRYDTLIQALRDAIFQEAHAKNQVLDEHIAIIDALLADDPEAAYATMARHVDHAADSVAAVLFSRKLKDGKPKVVKSQAPKGDGTFLNLN